MAKHAYLGSTKLLSFNNPKMSKSLNYGYFTAALHLAPFTTAGRGNVCAFASKGCAAACLTTAGNPAYLKAKTQARVKRTRFFFKDRQGFYVQLVKEITAFILKCERLDTLPAIRLNATSDIKYPKWLFDKFPTVMFYDYTANHKAQTRAVNHHLTYSRKEDTSDKQVLDMINAGKKCRCGISRTV